LVGLVLLWPSSAPGLLRLTWLVNCLSALLLMGLFGIPVQAPGYLYYLFAVCLGSSMAGTELAALQLAVRQGEEGTLRRRISWFSANKAIGVGSGFLLGGLVAGASWSAGPARVLVVLTGILMGCLSLGMLLRPREPAPEGSMREEGPRAGAGLLRAAMLGGLLILVNFTLVNAWSAVVPVRLGKEGALLKEWIGLLLAIESYCHAMGNVLFQERVGRIGNSRSFLLGYGASLAVLALLFLFPRCGMSGYLLLLGLLGLCNALTYLSSTTLFYSAGLPRGIFARIAVHKLCSSLGRALGSWIALRILLVLDR
jgi:hypothetical protein